MIAISGGTMMLPMSSSLKPRELHRNLYLQLLGSAVARNPKQPLMMTIWKAPVPMMTPVHWLHSQTTAQSATLPLRLRAFVPSLLDVQVQDTQGGAHTEHMLETCMVQDSPQAFLNVMMMMMMMMMMVVMMMVMMMMVVQRNISPQTHPVTRN